MESEPRFSKEIGQNGIAFAPRDLGVWALRLRGAGLCFLSSKFDKEKHRCLILYTVMSYHPTQPMVKHTLGSKHEADI